MKSFDILGKREEIDSTKSTNWHNYMSFMIYLHLSKQIKDDTAGQPGPPGFWNSNLPSQLNTPVVHFMGY